LVTCRGHLAEASGQDGLFWSPLLREHQVDFFHAADDDDHSQQFFLLFFFMANGSSLLKLATLFYPYSTLCQKIGDFG
jgi:hypothetical protein